LIFPAGIAAKEPRAKQIVVALVVIWILFAVLSWLLHAAKWLLFVAIIASLVAVAAKYLRQIIR